MIDSTFHHQPWSDSPSKVVKSLSLPEAYRALFPPIQGLAPKLAGALAHLQNSMGNLGRAKLAKAVSIAGALPESSANKLAMAVEYFHTASLVLDDLPMMDDALLRRGQPCVHRIYGESAALLAALALINRAHSLIWEVCHEANLPASRELAPLLEQCLGALGICNGQALDLSFQHSQNSPEMVEAIAQLKTGALFLLALALPAVVSGMPTRVLEPFQDLATHWGNAYQLLDDLADVFSTCSTTGKTTQQDAHLFRPNMVLSEGSSQAINRLFSHLAKASQSLRSAVQVAPALHSLQHFQEKLERMGMATLVNPEVA